MDGNAGNTEMVNQCIVMGNEVNVGLTRQLPNWKSCLMGGFAGAIMGWGIAGFLLLLPQTIPVNCVSGGICAFLGCFRGLYPGTRSENWYLLFPME